MNATTGHCGLPIACALTLALAGCGLTDQVSTDAHEANHGLAVADLAAGGVAIMTPSGAAGQDSYKRGLAQTFATVLHQRYPTAQVVDLPEFLTAVNAHGDAGRYRDLFNDYEDTGLLEAEALKAIGHDTGVRYVAHLDLARFTQGSNKRFGAAGLRLLDTKVAGIRMALEVWDAETGALVWQGNEELHYSYETVREKPVTFNTVATMATEDLLKRIEATDAPATLLGSSGTRAAFQ